MSELPGKENPAFAGELPLKEIKSDLSGDVADSQVTLYEVNSDPSPNHRQSGLTNGDLAHGEALDDDLEPKPKPFNPLDHNVIVRFIMAVQTAVSETYTEHKVTIWRFIGIILLVAFLVYFGFAIDHEFGSEASYRLLICTILGLALLMLVLLQSYLKPLTGRINKFITDPSYKKIRFIIRWALYFVSTAATVALIIWLVALDNPDNLLSLAGLAGFILICFLTSCSPAQVNWHPVFWGFSLQFYFACLILKTDAGFDAFKWLGDRVTEFLAYSDAGAAFVFSDYAKIVPLDGSKPIEFLGVYSIHFFAFKLMPVVTFFSTVIAICYYLGVMQAIINVIGRFLSFCLGTTAAESINAAGNIFVAMTESPLMIGPFIPTMTRSELHAVMTGGFATIAGSVLGAYIGFGVPANHLLSASVMSAPAALAISKLTYPEIDIPSDNSAGFDRIEKTKEGNVIEAACNGAIMSAKIIACIIVNIIAFLSLLAFLNATLVWFGERVGKDDFTFEKRSEVIATYALCGFSNCGSMGIMLGALSAMAPRRRPTMAKLVLRAMLAGNVACFFTACIAGLFYEPSD
ncbi:sodium/nucleoside cotransporter [Elysia marginata]|uniref:Sodium/nucleoside cotransporter n=1 Tax=Elysia marginata TaxID=1093978 RepID=A0AAV4HAA9_9GAST|nr:sodium/nucleoside cotransporter [Elysia marginata]